jgi:hypothetical protein
MRIPVTGARTTTPRHALIIHVARQYVGALDNNPGAVLRDGGWYTKERGFTASGALAIRGVRVKKVVAGEKGLIELSVEGPGQFKGSVSGLFL